MQGTESQLLKGLVVFVSVGVTAKWNGDTLDRTSIEKLLHSHSALVVRNLNNRVNYLVSSEEIESALVKKAVENGIKVIRVGFFVDGIKRMKMQPEGPYVLKEGDGGFKRKREDESWLEENAKKEEKGIGTKQFKDEKEIAGGGNKKIKIYKDEMEKTKVYKDEIEKTKVYKDEIEKSKVYKDEKEKGKVYKDEVENTKKYKDEAEKSKKYKDEIEKGKYKDELEKSKNYKDDNEASKSQAPKKGFVPVDSNCKTLYKTSQVYHSSSGPWSFMLNQVNISNNNNKFYTGQLLKDKEDNYWCWFRWGRVGKVGQFKLSDCSSLSEAKATFCAKFLEKSGNEWEKRHKFHPVKGKYILLDIDFGGESDSEDERSKEEKKDTTPSLLDPSVVNLVETIFDKKILQKSLIEMDYNFEKTPLGGLKKSVINQASIILAKIEKQLKKDHPNKNELLDLSNQFYSFIPHFSGMKALPVIDKMKTVKKKQKMLEELKLMKIANKVISDSDHTENPVDSQYKALGVRISLLPTDSAVYLQIQKYVKNTHGSTHNYKINIRQVFCLTREEDEQRFQHYGQLSNHLLLWHGSRMSNFVGILSEGLRIAPPEAPATGYMFGKGLYFADMVSKSANYCHASEEDPKGLLLLYEVALGNTWNLKESNEQIVSPPSPYHSTKGLGGVAPNPSQNEPEVGNPNCFIPSGKQIQTGIDSELLYNEYIVYNEGQCRMRYLVFLDFVF